MSDDDAILVCLPTAYPDYAGGSSRINCDTCGVEMWLSKSSTDNPDFPVNLVRVCTFCAAARIREGVDDEVTPAITPMQREEIRMRTGMSDAQIDDFLTTVPARTLEEF